MKQPVLQNQAFCQDVESRVRASRHFDLWWLGQSGFLIQWQGRRFLFDPYLSDSLTYKYARTNKPHVRISERVVEPQRLTDISFVTSTHNHTDHLDAETLLPLWQVNPLMQLVVPRANQDFAANRLGCGTDALLPIDAGQQVKVGPFTIHAVPAAHEQFDQDEQGRFRHLGYLVQFDGWCIYHSGDTIRYPQMNEWLRPFEIDLALLPINGRLPSRGVPGNLWGDEAAQLAQDIGARTVIPHHYDLFAFNTVSPDDFERACQQRGQAYVILEQGGRFCSEVLA